MTLIFALNPSCSSSDFAAVNSIADDFCFLHCSGIIRKRSDNCVQSIYYSFFIRNLYIFLVVLCLLVSFSVAIARYRNKKFVYFQVAHNRCRLVRGKCVLVHLHHCQQSTTTNHSCHAFLTDFWNCWKKNMENFSYIRVGIQEKNTGNNLISTATQLNLPNFEHKNTF